MSNTLKTFGLDGFLSYVFFVLIWGLFIAAIIGIVRRHNKIRHDSDIDFSKEIDSANTYYGSFAEYEKYLVDYPIDESIDESDKQEVKTVKHRLMSFGDFLDVSEIAPAKFPTPKLTTSIPSILTILGILGTFIVLVISLGSLKSDAKDMTLQIANLLTGTKTAYFKSVWGVGCSLIVTFVERWMSDYSQIHVNRVIRKVDSLHTLLTPEKIAIDNLFDSKRSVLIVDKGLSDLKNQSITSSKGIESQLHLVEKATLELSAKFNGFEETMTNVAKKGAESQNEAIRELLRDVVEEFRDQMVNGVKEGLQQLTTAMDASSDRLNEFSKTTSEVSDKLNTTVVKLVDIHGELNRNIDGINESLESVAETMDAAKETTDRCLAILKEMADGTEVNQDAIQQLYMTVKKLEPTIVAVQQCQLRSEENVEKMAQSVREIDESLSGFSQKLSSDLGSFIGEFSGAADTLTGAGQDFANQVSDHVQKYCSDLDNSLASAVTSLKNGVTEIQDGVVPSAETLTRTVGSISQTMTQLNDALTRLQPSGEKIKQMAELMTVLRAIDLPKDESST